MVSDNQKNAKTPETLEVNGNKDDMKDTAKTDNDLSKWGYDLYPERKGEKYENAFYLNIFSINKVFTISRYKTSWSRVFFGVEGRENMDKVKCERNVFKCVQNSPLVKLMMGALRSSGCPIDIRRHFSCEVCDPSVTGGYDPVLNQIVICQNSSRSEGMVQGVLTHELIHMFDFCKNELDFQNIDHLACTEIRAANLAHCSFLSAWSQGDASMFNIKAAHQNCKFSVKFALIYTFFLIL